MRLFRTFALIWVAVLPFLAGFGCASATATNSGGPSGSSNKTTNAQSLNNAPASASKGATIPIEPNGPADTVRLFYKDLRERKFREAIFLTNIRPAIEGLTDMELKEFQVDFEAIAGIVPPEIQINGEIVSG